MMLNKLIRFLKEYPWGALLIAYGIFETILKLLRNASASAGSVRWLLESGTRVDQQKAVPAGWLIAVIAAAFIGFGIFLGAYIVTQVRLNRSRTKNIGLRTLDGMFDSTAKIRKSLWPTGKKPPHFFTTIKMRHLIHDDLTVTSSSEYHVRAKSMPVHYFVWNTLSEDEALPRDHLLEIDFRVKDITPERDFETTYLQCANGPRNKEVLVYFLPILQPEEDVPRIIEVSFVWPGYYLRLKEKEELYSIDLTKMRSEERVDLIELEFYLEPGTGKRLICERTGSVEGKQAPPSAARFKHSSGKDWEGWKYTVRKAPAEEYAVLLRLEGS